jgi:threonine dehydrogenase-like Zn-dependent dehydrogenase
MMQAAIFEGQGRTSLAAAPVPEPAPGQVRIRLRGSGVCGSNLPVWEGRPWFRYPLAPGQPGHEGWGVIDAVGDDVIGLAAGDAVACLSQAAYAEFDLAAGTDVVALPDALAAGPCPGEPLACAVNVISRTRLAAGQPVVIVGIGFLGALLVQLAAARGAHVIAVSRRPFARDIARACGAADAVPFDDEVRTRDAVLRRLGDEGAPCVIEAVGDQHALDLAASLVAVRGQLVIAGYHQDGPRTVDLQQWNWRGLDVTNAHERDPQMYRDGLRLAIAALAAGALRLEPLLTTRLPLDRLDDAFRMMQARPDGFLKAVVCCD